jgi:hypothetical protein
MAQQPQNQEEQWFLRTSGDTVFGPVTPEGLVVWAEQGRVLPGHEVSTDRKKWIPAVSLAILKMQWYVDDGDGELRGPLHRAAAEALVKSGKVSEQAHILSSEEVDLAESSESKAKPNGELSNPATQTALTQRIQELELQLTERDRREKPEANNTRTVNQLTQERDAQAARIAELETLCETLKRNADKDLRAADKKMETLRGQNKKLEEQLEDLKGQISKAKEETVQWQEERDKREREKHEASSLSDAVERQYGDVLARTEQMKQDFDHLHLEHEKLMEDIQKAHARTAEAERDFADLLDMANTRDAEYLEKIAELERFSSQSPEKIAQFYADQAGVYQLFQNELEALSKEQESERTHLEHLKQISMKRLDAIQERKQSLTRQLGASPADMTRLSVREQTTDPASARIRTEFDTLRFVHERDMRASEERERELIRKLRLQEIEANRLKTLALDGERFGQQVQDLTDQLHRRENELAEERKVRENERSQFQVNQQALVSRIETLEKGGRTEARTSQITEGRSGKLPSWMHLK